MWKKRLMWARVGIGVRVDFSKLESELESLKFGRRCSTGHWAVGCCKK